MYLDVTCKIHIYLPLALTGIGVQEFAGEYATEQPHAPDQRNRGDFGGWDAIHSLPDLSNQYPRWQVMGSVRLLLSTLPPLTRELHVV